MAVRPAVLLATLGLMFAALLPASAAHTQASLVLSADSARPGETVTAGVVMRMDSTWHTYWRNSGASGMPTRIDWKLPPGITAGEVQWPVPEILIESDFTTYIYKDTTVLLVPLKLANDLKPGQVQLNADVSWLECAVQCVPGDAKVQASLTIGPENKPSASAAMLKEWEARLPQKDNTFGAKGSWEGPAKGDLRTLLIEWGSKQAANNPDFLPYSSEQFEVGGAVKRLGADAGQVRISKEVKKLSGDWPREIPGVAVQVANGKKEACEAVLKPGQTTAISGEVAAEPKKSLGMMLLYAFIGGLILNVMPCVLPVIALKILGFVSQGHNEPRQARKLGLIYGLGVIVSFLAIAALVIVAKAAGQKAGWGFQFGNPYFLIAMTTLVTLIALNLFGVFEVQLGGGAMDAAAKLSSKHGASGAFFNGLLATVLATSCTAPFLGAAIGFAFAQPPLIILLVLATVGLGLAAPYVVLSWQPGWLKWLPRPGPWMERFKVAVGFPMLAAAVWLFSIAALHYGERSWWLAIFLVFVAVAAWIYGEFVQRHRRNIGMALVAVALVLFNGYWFVLEGQLKWRSPAASSGPNKTIEVAAGGIQWQPWSRQAVEKAQAEGRPVLVDFTAKWCLTCNTIVKPALESSSVREKVRQLNAAAFLGDYTGFSDEITDELNRYGRAGVPLVLVFPKVAGARPIVLPEAITPGMVVKALEQAAN